MISFPFSFLFVILLTPHGTFVIIWKSGIHMRAYFMLTVFTIICYCFTSINVTVFEMVKSFFQGDLLFLLVFMSDKDPILGNPSYMIASTGDKDSILGTHHI